MIPEINAAVQRYPNLHLQVNKREIHRVRRNEITSGSLWLEKQMQGYRLQLTGEMVPLLTAYVIEQVGEPAYVDKGYDVWRLPFDGTMEKIIRRVAEAQV